MRHRHAGGRAPSVPRRSAAPSPRARTAAESVRRKVPMAKGIITPSRTPRARKEASKVPNRVETRLSCTREKRIAGREKGRLRGGYQ